MGTAAVTAAVALTLYPTDARRTAVLAYLAVGAAVMLVIRLAIEREAFLTFWLEHVEDLVAAGQADPAGFAAAADALGVDRLSR